MVEMQLSSSPWCGTGRRLRFGAAQSTVHSELAADVARVVARRDGVLRPDLTVTAVDV